MSQRKPSIIWTSLAIASLLLTPACTAKPEAPEGRERQEPLIISGLQWNDGSRIEARQIDLHTADEKTIGDFFSSYAAVDRWTDTQEHFDPLALTGQGDVVGGYSIAMEPVHDDTDLSSRGEIGLARDGEFEAFASTVSLVPDDGNRMVVDATVDDDSVVWVETESYLDATSTWRIFAGGPGKNSELLAKADDYSTFEQRPPIIQNPTPVIDRGTVYWQGLVDNGEGNFGLALFAQRGVEAHGAEIVAHGANHPVVVDSGIAVIDSAVNLSPGEDGAPAGSLIVSQSISVVENGTRTRLLEITDLQDGSSALETLSGSGQTLITTFRDQLLILDLKTKQVQAFSAPEQKEAGFAFSPAGPEVCGRYATWTYTDPRGHSNGIQYFFDLETQKLSKVLEKDLLGKVFCGGRYFSWMLLNTEEPGSRAHAAVMRWKN